MFTNRQSNKDVKFLPSPRRNQPGGDDLFCPKKSQGVILWCEERTGEAGENLRKRFSSQKNLRAL
jgi:hypothetical protein